jgi:hypothetical protein
MGSRSTYVRRIEQLESAVVGFGHSVAGRRPAARAAHHHAVKLAVDALVGSPLAEASDVRRIRVVEDVDFHVRHIDRLLDELGPGSATQLDLRRALHALDLALAGFAAHDLAPLVRLDHAVERILGDADPPALCRVALHMHAIAEATRSAASHEYGRRPAPVA